MFRDREDAARQLSLKLLKKIKEKDLIVSALARGGVILGKIIAETLFAPLETVVVKKIGAPLRPELAIGAIAPKNTIYWNEDVCRSLGLSKEEMQAAAEKKEKERKNLEDLLPGKNKLNHKAKTMILVDDGVATGASVLACLKYFKKEKAKKIILATPVISEDTYKELKEYFEEIIYVKKIKKFYAVGQFYKDFKQVDNDEVIRIIGN